MNSTKKKHRIRGPGKVIRSKTDMKWLREVHLPKLPAKYKSAVIYGNEDSPEQIEVFVKKNPLVTDSFRTFTPERRERFRNRGGESA